MRTPVIPSVPNGGYQPNSLGLDGSSAALLTLFPSQSGPSRNFWSAAGVEAMGPDPARFDKRRTC